MSSTELQEHAAEANRLEALYNELSAPLEACAKEREAILAKRAAAAQSVDEWLESRLKGQDVGAVPMPAPSAEDEKKLTHITQREAPLIAARDRCMARRHEHAKAGEQLQAALHLASLRALVGESSGVVASLVAHLDAAARDLASFLGLRAHLDSVAHSHGGPGDARATPIFQIANRLPALPSAAAGLAVETSDILRAEREWAQRAAGAPVMTDAEILATARMAAE